MGELVGMNNNVLPGSKWYSSDCQIFKVEMVYENSAGTWVTYINTKTDQVYDCLIEAFLNRFTEKANEG